MKYGVDSNIGVRWILDEGPSAEARIIRDEFHQGIHELLAPNVFMVEASHAVTRAQREGRVLPAEVEPLLDDLMATPPDFLPHAPLLGHAIEISVATRHNVYDCLYVALAEREGCELLTADGKLIGKLQAAFPFITRLV